MHAVYHRLRIGYVDCTLTLCACCSLTVTQHAMTTRRSWYLPPSRIIVTNSHLEAAIPTRCVRSGFCRLLLLHVYCIALCYCLCGKFTFCGCAARHPTLTQSDIQEVASLLKLYLRQLPEPLLTNTLYHAFLDAAAELKTNAAQVCRSWCQPCQYHSHCVLTNHNREQLRSNTWPNDCPFLMLCY